MKIGLIGHGNTGKIIEKVLRERGHDVPNIVTKSGEKILGNAEVYIDFSSPEGLFENIKVLNDLKIPIILGTTGWYERKNDLEKIIVDSGNICIWGGNFSIGVNLFYSIIKFATKKIDKFNETYDVFVHEFHHSQKGDSPSGTAIQIGNFILGSSSVKNKIVSEKLDRKIGKDELHISSTRGGNIPGIHEVIFDSKFDTLSFEHSARTREGFAFGAVIAAENIKKLSPGFYNFADIFDDFFKQ